MVFDVTSRGSFEALPGWYNEVMKLNNSTRTDIVGFVVGNKVGHTYSNDSNCGFLTTNCHTLISDTR
jgi:hypothetical protein